MSHTEILVHGTLKPDGTLELDQKPNLPPGRVTILLRQEAAPAAQEGWWPYMQRVRAEREAAGYHFMNEEEVQAYIEWLREPDQIDEMLQHADEERRSKEHP